MFGHVLWLIVGSLGSHACWLAVCALVLDIRTLGVTRVGSLIVVSRIGGVVVSITRRVDASAVGHRFVRACYILHFVRLTSVGCLVWLTSRACASMMADGMQTRNDGGDDK